ncbi:MAG: type II secretion system minor pseudopilin GspK [Pseudomonadota bacterium]
MRAQRVPRRLRGVALVMMMLLLSMAVILAAQVMERLEQDRARTENVLLQEQMYAYLLSAEALGVRALAGDLVKDRQDRAETDACDEQDWAQSIGPLPWDNGVFQVSMQDLQGRFNLNNLVVSNEDGERSIDRVQAERLKRLLRSTLPEDVAAEAAEALTEEAADWTDSNTLVDGLGGAEDTEYEAWRTGNQPFGAVSELRALRSATREQWLETDDKPLFSRYITVLPEGTKINVNTAPVEVLQALLPTLGSGGAEAIVSQRTAKPFATVDDVLALPALSSLADAARNEFKAAIAVNSDYFQVVSQVRIDGRTARLVSQVYRPRQEGMARVIMRDLGDAFSEPEEACNPGTATEAADDSGAGGAG